MNLKRCLTMCPSRILRPTLTMILVATWAAGASREVQAKDPQSPVVRAQDEPGKLPPLPKDAEPVKVLGEVGWPREIAGKAPGPQPFKPAPLTFLSGSKDELLKAWVADGGRKECPPVYLPMGESDQSKTRAIDFEKEMVIGVFWRGATDRNQVKIERVSKQGDKLIVEYRASTHNRGGAAPRPLNVNHVVVLPKQGLKVEFQALPAIVTVDTRPIP